MGRFHIWSLFGQAQKVVDDLPKTAHVIRSKSAAHAALLDQIEATPEVLAPAQAELTENAGLHPLPDPNPILDLKFPGYAWPSNKKRSHLELRNMYLLYRAPAPPSASNASEGGPDNFVGGFDLREILNIERLPALGKVIMTFTSSRSQKPGPVELFSNDHNQLAEWHTLLTARWEYVWMTISKLADNWAPQP